MNKKRPDIVAYAYSTECGLGQAALMNIQAMRSLGLEVEHRRWEGHLPNEDGLNCPEQIYYHHWHPQRQEASRIWHSGEFGCARHVAYWAYEAVNDLPPEFLQLAPRMHEIWVPSRFCKEVFEPCGAPVHIVPHAVPDEIRSAVLSPPRTANAGTLVVFFVFDAWSRLARKNPEASIRVFQRAFAERQDVRLVIKAHHLSSGEEEHLRQCCGSDQRIILHNAFIDKDALCGLYESADIFLSLQRAEGFGLNIAHALAIGLPVITTAFGGHLDFCNEETAFLVRKPLSNCV